ncbi:carboxylating nicotinate-nucleotide diphosphorylase [Amphibacillus cookii]|uniref:carboxylating nicotinate-nucleotide diphosphorylase n=1 Tax=Amphibacillus cookii TaxID=767787 RepID=UPI00195AD14E|nr:carboxylating nicotinate-nucleotide diphosphorylase [Amphibacillus cookii]MBM7541764.1 nicotinate-nucleotide pyrophosphorylase (carboxylating) [Amphibacillus cookii]
MNHLKAKHAIENFLLEDIGDRDLTSDYLFSKTHTGQSKIVAKQSGVLSGINVIEIVYQCINPTVIVNNHKCDGEHVQIGEVISTITGPLQAILSGERVALNLLQRMSGIASLTATAVSQLSGEQTRITDTRKTTPGLRLFEKYAVTCGGGFNHRFGLYDGVMIKDNHIAYYGSIESAVQQIRSKLGHMVKIEVETEHLDQVEAAVKSAVDIIMFDNQTVERIRQYIKHIPEHIITEASGNITLDMIKDYQDTGVDYLALGFITHSAKSFDFSMNIEG